MPETRTPPRPRISAEALERARRWLRKLLEHGERGGGKAVK